MPFPAAWPIIGGVKYGTALLHALGIVGTAAMVPVGIDALNTKNKRQRSLFEQLIANRNPNSHAMRMETNYQHEMEDMIDNLEGMRMGMNQPGSPVAMGAMQNEAVRAQLSGLIDQQSQARIAETAYTGATDPIQMMARLGMR